jgi:hypothetical protein
VSTTPTVTGTTTATATKSTTPTVTGATSPTTTSVTTIYENYGKPGYKNATKAQDVFTSLKKKSSVTITASDGVNDIVVDSTEVAKIKISAEPTTAGVDIDVAATFTVEPKPLEGGGFETIDGCVFEYLVNETKAALEADGYTDVNVTCSNVVCDNDDINVCPPSSGTRRRRDGEQSATLEAESVVECTTCDGCGGAAHIRIPDGTSSIGNYAFEGCSSLVSVVIPDSVTSIGSHAFKECSSLVSVVIGDSVDSILQSAFYGCINLVSVIIPNKVTSIRDYTFAGCSSLESVVIPDTVTSIGYTAFAGCSSLASVVIPDSVTSIGSHAFAQCSSLASVVIPDSVTSIGSHAFYECSSLESAVIPDTVTSIGDSAFAGCGCQEELFESGVAVCDCGSRDIVCMNDNAGDVSCDSASKDRSTECGDAGTAFSECNNAGVCVASLNLETAGISHLEAVQNDLNDNFGTTANDDGKIELTQEKIDSLTTSEDALIREQANLIKINPGGANGVKFVVRVTPPPTRRLRRDINILHGTFGCNAANEYTEAFLNWQMFLCPCNAAIEDIPISAAYNVRFYEHCYLTPQGIQERDAADNNGGGGGGGGSSSSDNTDSGGSGDVDLGVAIGVPLGVVALLLLVAGYNGYLGFLVRSSSGGSGIVNEETPLFTETGVSFGI